ncbi:MAG: hypothetical protein CSA68_02085 [Rhodobacterales bacterium]|nr:MAG: hypothetical protein CSA68_02085 [Rhodobacterales bacterium]
MGAGGSGVGAGSGTGSGLGAGSGFGAGGCGRASGVWICGVSGAGSGRDNAANSCAEMIDTSAICRLSSGRSSNNPPIITQPNKAAWPMPDMRCPRSIFYSSRPSNFGPPESVTSPISENPPAFRAPMICTTRS